MRIESNTFEGGMQVMDGNEWVACEFRDCTIVFAGRAGCTITGCRFANPQYQLAENALQTVNQLHALYHGLPGGKEFVESVFEYVRRQ